MNLAMAVARRSPCRGARAALFALLGALLAMLFLPAAGFAQDYDFPASQAPQRQLAILSTTDIEISEPAIRAFQARNPNVAIYYRELTTLELDGLVSPACRDGTPAGDLVISSAMDLQFKLVNDGCALPADSPVLMQLPDYARWRGELFGLTFEPAAIVYNRDLIAADEAPDDRFQLLELLRDSSRFKGKVGTYDIEQSGLGYLYATLDAQQSSTFGRLLEAFARNDVQLFCCTSDILDRVIDGRLAIGYNVLGSYALGRAAANPKLAIVLPSDYTLVLTRAAFVPKFTRNRADAVAFLEFLLGRDGQSVVAEKTFLFSPIDGAERLFRDSGLPPDARQSLRPVSLGPALLAGLDRLKKQAFFRQWQATLSGR